MKVTEIKRTISGRNYDNLTATATVEEGENPIEIAMYLDGTLRDALYHIEEQHRQESEKKREKEEFLQRLRMVMQKLEADEDIPF